MTTTARKFTANRATFLAGITHSAGWGGEVIEHAHYQAVRLVAVRRAVPGAVTLFPAVPVAVEIEF